MEGFQLGLFAVNWLYSLTHLAIGVLYLALFLLGLVLPTVFGLVPLFGAPDLLVHLGTAVVA